METSAETEEVVKPKQQPTSGHGDGALYLVFTMDCLPARPRGGVPGPQSWDTATGCLLEFASALESRDLKSTFFVVPEAAKQLQDPVEQVRDCGMEAGLLCHPPIAGYRRWLGAYSYDTQREIVELARNVWQQRLGIEVKSFRPGFFSANDYTFQILLMEGFNQGSCSLPGKVNEDQCSSWHESCPLPRHTDPLDKNLRGTMEFYEVPVTSDFEASAADADAGEEFVPAHLSLDNPHVAQQAPALARKHLARMEDEGPEVRTLTFHGSNFPRQGEEEPDYGRVIENILDGIRPIAEEYEVTLRSATLAEVHREADRASGSVGPAN